MLAKKDIINLLIISEAEAFLFLPIWLNLGIFLELWPWRWLLFIIAPVLAYIFLATAKWLNKKAKWQTWQGAKYLFIGVLNTFLDFGILNFLSYLTGIYSGWRLGVFNVAAFFLPYLNSYLWNRYWAFSAEGKIKIKELARFLAVSLIGFLINTSVLIILSEILKNIFGGLESQIVENIANAFAGSSSALWSYFGYKTFVFRKKLILNKK